MLRMLMREIVPSWWGLATARTLAEQESSDTNRRECGDVKQREH